MRTCANFRVKRKNFYRKSELPRFLLISGGHILVDHSAKRYWSLHTQLYKSAGNVSASNSETAGLKDLRLGQTVYILVICNIHFLGFFHWAVSNFFVCCVAVPDS